MTKPRRTLAYSAEYEFGDNNLLTATFLEEKRLRNDQRVKQAHSVVDVEGDGRTVNHAKKFQQEQDRELEIYQDNMRLLDRLDRIHKKIPKQFDVSHHTDAHLNVQPPTNYFILRRDQERIAEENKKMKRRLDQTKSMFDNKHLAAEAAKYRYFAEKLSKADRRVQVKQRCKQLGRHVQSKRQENSLTKPHHDKRQHQDIEREYSLDGIHDCEPDHLNPREHNELPRVRGSLKVKSKYTAPQDNFPTVTNTSKFVRASDLLPRLGC